MATRPARLLLEQGGWLLLEQGGYLELDGYPAVEIPDGTVSVTLDGATVDATGSPVITGTVVATLDGATVDAAGSPVAAGTIAVALADATIAAESEVLSFGGSAVATLAAIGTATVTVIEPHDATPALVGVGAATATIGTT